MRTGAIKKEGTQYRVASPLLLLFSASFVVWQMGVLFYSGTTMSLFGRTPIPLTDADTSAVIAAGYSCSIVFICLFPRLTVWAERVLLPVALIATCAMLLPLSASVITALFYISAFVCCFSIGTMASLAAQHFTLDTVWRDGIIGIVAGGVIIALLQNDLYKVGFTAFSVFSVLLLAGLCVFHWMIPAKIEVRFATRGGGERLPGVIFYGLWLVSAFATLLLCFASSYAESVSGGVSVLYLSASLLGAALGALRRKHGEVSPRLLGGFFGLTMLGFILALLSPNVPGLDLAACALLGFTVVLSSLWIFYAATAFAVYPTRYIGAIGAGMGLALALLHSGLLSALRHSPTLLYGVYAVLCAALMLVYYFLEPYFTFALREHTAARAAQAPKEQPTGETPPAPVRDVPPALSALSEQERSLASLILSGYTESSIASAMNISINTQKSYRKNLYAKLDIHSKRELFELAKKA